MLEIMFFSDKIEIVNELFKRMKRGVNIWESESNNSCSRSGNQISTRHKSAAQRNASYCWQAYNSIYCWRSHKVRYRRYYNYFGKKQKSDRRPLWQSYELEQELKKKGNHDLLKLVQDISNLANIHYIRQKEAKGLGHAIYCAKSFIGNEPFAVLLGDDIVDSEVPCIKQLNGCVW